MRAVALLPLLLVVAAACGEKDPPNDCGSPDMSIVTVASSDADHSPLRWCVDIHAASRVDASATSAGLDESYAVSRAGVYPWTNLTFEEASDACGRAGKQLCDAFLLGVINPPTGFSAPGFLASDATVVEAVPRNGAETSVPARFDVASEGESDDAQLKRTAYPDARASVAFYTIAPESQDDEKGGADAYVVGAVSGNRVSGGIRTRAPVPKTGFKHPLVGFRCCVLAQLRDAFPPVSGAPRLRSGPDGEVPLAP